MNICVFGLGYVGAVSSACLANDGHNVIGVDPYQVKTDLINEGHSPVIEDKIEELVGQGVSSGRLRATTKAREAIMESELAFVCVGTPSQPNGALDLSYVERVSEDIGSVLKDKDDYFVVVIRSTVLPGTTTNLVIPALERTSGKVAGVDFGVCMNPEFLREGTAVDDFYDPPKVVIGCSDDKAADLLEPLGAKGGAPIIRCPLEVAEMVKYVDNTWHAVKVAFANEIGRVSKANGIDGQAVMDIFVQDEKLNLSNKYLRPGFGFGGSCLPKDVRAINAHARGHDLELPLLAAVLPSNERHIETALDLVLKAGSKKVSVLGLSFKAGTDDMRESPMVEVVERLIGKGFDLRIFDENINLARLMGANQKYILDQIPHIGNLMVNSMDEALSHGETIVIGNGAPEFREVPGKLTESQSLIDFVRVSDDPKPAERYEGLGW